MAGKTALSDWELRELEHYARCGWTAQELGWHYGLNERSVQRLLRRMGVETIKGRIKPDERNLD